MPFCVSQPKFPLIEPDLISRMFCGQDLTLLFRCHLSVYLRRLDRAVSEHSLYIANIDIFFKQQGSERVPKHMWGNMNWDAGLFAELPNREPY